MRAPIEVAMPFVAATQDEKMYRVVTDRERWFNVVMGGEALLRLDGPEHGLGDAKSADSG